MPDEIIKFLTELHGFHIVEQSTEKLHGITHVLLSDAPEGGVASTTVSVNFKA